MRISEQAVLAALGGTPAVQIAAQQGIPVDELQAAIGAYRNAGRAALQNLPADLTWHQVRIRFHVWKNAETIAAQFLAPTLERAREQGRIGSWWYIRKHPCWRLRVHRSDAGTAHALDSVLRQIESHGVDRWWRTRYEPETLAFGGSYGIHIAHELFSADSAAILGYLRDHARGAPGATIGRRETSLILLGALLRGAGLDRHEKADVWHRVVLERPLDPEPPDQEVHRLARKTGLLLAISFTPDAPLLGSGRIAWLDAFAQAGGQLGQADQNGDLHHGLRDILAKHVIFHWNRVGLSARTQAVLARAARHALLQAPQQAA